MLFDYSSTVNEFLKEACSRNRNLLVIVPESRLIDGGKPYIDTCLKTENKIKFIPDAAIMHYLQQCDGAFFGAETFFPDGTVFNTTGSDLVGIICKEFNIPLYILTPLIKADVRSVYGYKKNLVYKNLKEKLSINWDHKIKENVDFDCPELLAISSEYITAYVTEKGIIPANQMFDLSISYIKDLKGE